MSLASLLTDTVNIWRSQPDRTVADDAFPNVADAPLDARRLIRDRRYCRVLWNESEIPFDETSCEFAWKALEHEMAFVPGGQVRLATHSMVQNYGETHEDDLIDVESCYLDRNCVTNEDYQRFVSAGGYSDAQYWPEEVLPSVLQFVDQDGCPGPKHWCNGEPPRDKLDHPVVGICWYEANAYASWAGKQLPSAQQWQRAGTWPKGQSGRISELRYPWGNAFDPAKANTFASRIGDTVPVNLCPAGNTPNGVRQLIGNVWEWIDAEFCPTTPDGDAILLDEAMAEIRGAAFDTYFHSQATCQFRTGQPLLFRGPNIGFRCCIDFDTLPVRSDSHNSSNTSHEK